MFKFSLSVLSVVLLFCSCGENHQANTVMEAYYQGTQSQSQLCLYSDGVFKVHHSGVFFFSDTKEGTYILDEDTLYLNSGSKSARLLSDTMIIKNDNLYMLKADSLINSFFTLKPKRK
ncbi:hypothetical protein [Dysgonomonas capnocytophagoides]|uniref:hypothetical protein n=1 Tax=Dysgonomonas capnocytophagoides TaxID=45254 RepID=UPI00333F679D